MDKSVIPAILKELNLDEKSVVNIYNYGSWVYGTNSAKSDRDFMIVTRISQDPLVFDDEIEYFHNFQLNKLWNQYDICVHSIENFERLLSKNYLLAVECIFLPNEFKIKEEIDFRQIYIDKYHNLDRLKTVAFYENYCAIKMLDPDSTKYPKRSSRSGRDDDTTNDYLFKNLFHGYRYLDIAEQLIQTKSIHNFKRVSHILEEMKEIRDQSSDDLQSVLNFICDISTEYKERLDELVPNKRVKGTFEAHITIECSNDTQNCIEKLKKTCENSKYKVIFINLNTKNQQKNKFEQLMTSSYHVGEYPSIVKQIQDEAQEYFKDFNIIRIKIESLASNEGVPEFDIEKSLFWNNQTNYFEFHYKFLVNNDQLEVLRNVCRKYHTRPLHLSHNAFQSLTENQFYYFVTMRIFDLGRKNSFEKNKNVIDYFESQRFIPLKIVREFVVYDSHIELDRNWI